MANYTVTRQTESTHVYGCDDFSTIQEEGQIASNAPNAPLDGTVIWKLEANNNYQVSVDDFQFVGATVVTANNPPGTYVWKDLPSPILGAVMEQVSIVEIKITLYLAPSASYPGFNTGGAFQMPTNNVSIDVNIEGCARLRGEGHNMRIIKPADTNTTTRIDIEGDLKSSIVGNVGNGEDTVHGTLPPKKEGDIEDRETLLMSYQVVAKEGYRYATAPSLSFTDKNYHVKRRVETKTNAVDSNENDIISVSFDIYKK